MTPEQALETWRHFAQILNDDEDRGPLLAAADVLAHELERRPAFTLDEMQQVREAGRQAERERDAAVAERDAAIEKLPETARTLGWLPPDEARLLREALERWETRDNASFPPCSVERGTVEGRDWEVLVAGISYDAGCAIEGFFERVLARAALRGHDPAGDHGPGTTSYPDSAAAEGRDEGWAARELAQAEKDIDALPDLVRGQRQPEEPRT